MMLYVYIYIWCFIYREMLYLCRERYRYWWWRWLGGISCLIYKLWTSQYIVTIFAQIASYLFRVLHFKEKKNHICLSIQLSFIVFSPFCRSTFPSDLFFLLPRHPLTFEALWICRWSILSAWVCLKDSLFLLKIFFLLGV